MMTSLHDLDAFSFCAADAISSGPVEDTDTTNFVAQLVSTLFFFKLLFVLTCLVSRLLCADFSLFLRGESRSNVP